MAGTVVCTGAVVRKGARILLVRQAEGHSLAGQWTVPWGQVDDGESPTRAAVREVREEAGIDARVIGFLGMQELPEPWLGMIGLVFLCEHVDGEPAPDSRETDDARYFSADEFRRHGETVEPLTAWLIRRVFEGRYRLMESDDDGPFDRAPAYL